MGDQCGGRRGSEGDAVKKQRHVDVAALLVEHMKTAENLLPMIATTYRPWTFTVSAKVAGRPWSRTFTARVKAGGDPACHLIKMRLEDFKPHPLVTASDITAEAVSPTGRKVTIF